MKQQYSVQVVFETKEQAEAWLKALTRFNQATYFIDGIKPPIEAELCKPRIKERHVSTCPA